MIFAQCDKLILHTAILLPYHGINVNHIMMLNLFNQWDDQEVGILVLFSKWVVNTFMIWPCNPGGYEGQRMIMCELERKHIVRNITSSHWAWPLA